MGSMDPDPIVWARMRPLRREEYERLVELGAFAGERVELIHGIVATMSPQGAPHIATVRRLQKLLDRALGDRAELFTQSALALAPDSEPEPDVAIVPPGDYSRRLPSEPLLVIEVADSSLRYDRLSKARLYAAAGVPELWIVNLVDGAVEVYREPRESGYAKVTSHGAGEVISPLAFPDIAVAVAGVLPTP